MVTGEEEQRQGGGFTISLADLMDMFIENRIGHVREEMHDFLTQVGVELEYNESVQNIDFEEIENYLKEQE